MKNLAKVFVGVDVSKSFLDIHIFPINESFRIKNDSNCFDKLLQRLNSHKVEQIVCESSGGYEQSFLEFMNKKNRKTWQVDPKRIKAFIVSEGIRAKTDKIDAKMIAKFASKNSCNYLQKNKSICEKKLKEFVRRQAELTALIAKEKTRLNGPTTKFSIKMISSLVVFMEKQKKKLAKEIENLITTNKKLNEKSEILKSIPGIGAISSSILISHLPELGFINSKEIAALVGVAPFNKESGKYKGISSISGGRSLPRKALYMSSLSASCHNQRFKNFYDKLILKGKKPKVALIAVARKIVVIANAMIKNNTKWKNEYETNIS